MRPLRTSGLVVAALVTGGTVAKKVAEKVTAHRTANGERWLVVTVNAMPELVAGEVAKLGAGVRTRISPAPGGRGTEVAARPSLEDGDKTPSTDDLRRALRELKSTAETGEVIRPDEPTTGKATPGGALMRAITRRAGGKGRL
jgi:hypothetical protein